MESYLIAMFQTLLAMLKISVKNPASKKKLKKVALEVYRTIKILWAGDPDFE